MNLPIQTLLKESKDPESIKPLILQAEKVLQTWDPTWSLFISAPLREEVLKLMGPFHEFNWHSDGGHSGAERHRMQCTRRKEHEPKDHAEAPIEGLLIEGNFLFDKPSTNDIRQALEHLGASEGELGDIWLRGDRGAQALCTPETALKLNKKIGMVRNVQISCEALKRTELQLPIQRLVKKLTTVEASTRIDAIASAGFGISRTKVVSQIKEGRLRLNWNKIKQPNKELTIGDQIQLEDRGTIEIIGIDQTKRQRWRVELMRR